MRYAIYASVVLIIIIGGVAICPAQLKVRPARPRRGGITLSVVSSRRPAPTSAGKGGVHISPGQNVSLPWTVTDSHGYRWDISNYGTINDGTNDAYDGGMQLQVGGTSFPTNSNARISKDRKEIEIGTWRHNNLAVSRRIFVNIKAGYCRWIDIFENTTGSDVQVSLRYYSNMGDSTARTYTTSGGTSITEKDWGIVTAYSSSSGRPAVAHVFATPGSKFKPTFQFTTNNDSLYYHATIKVPAGKTVALCFFEAQRRPYDQAVKFLKEFDTARELRLVPAPLRQILLNMGLSVLSLGRVVLKRSDQSDLFVLRNGNEIHGGITTEHYVLRTDFGTLKIPAGKVLGLVSRSAGNSRVHLIATDGQIFDGELTSGPLVLKLTGGTVLKIPPKGLSHVSYRISPQKPEQPAITDSLAILRSGARLAFDESATGFAFTTQHGPISLSTADMRFIEMDTPGGGLHRAVFRNGSTLAGLLTAERIRLKLKLSPAELTKGSATMEVSRQRIKRFAFATAPSETKNLARLTFRNGDTIFGRFADAKWTVRGKFGSVSVAPSDVAAATFSAAALGEVKLTLRDGTELEGKLADNYVKFKIEPGPALKIFVGHIKSITGGASAGTTRPATTPAAGAPTDYRVKCVKCGQEWTIKPEELGKYQFNSKRPVGADCPKCSAKGTVFVMIKCPACESLYLPSRVTKPEAFAVGKARDVCPKCGTDLVKWYIKHRPRRPAGNTAGTENEARKKAEIKKMRASVAALQRERAAHEAKLAKLRAMLARNPPDKGPALQKFLKEHEKRLAEMQAREAELKKRMAQTEAALQKSSR